MTEQMQPPTDASSTPPTSEDQADIIVSPVMIESLRATKPWTLLLAILGFVAAGFMTLSGLISFVGFTVLGHNSPAGPFPFVFLALANILVGLLYIIPSYFLLKYAFSIRSLVNYGGQQAMEQALSYQKSFWKFAGILTLISIVFAILGMAAAIIIPQMAHFR